MHLDLNYGKAELHRKQAYERNLQNSTVSAFLREIDQFIESYGKDELDVQLEKLNFKNPEVSESTRNFILD